MIDAPQPARSPHNTPFSHINQPFPPRPALVTLRVAVATGNPQRADWYLGAAFIVPGEEEGRRRVNYTLRMQRANAVGRVQRAARLMKRSKASLA